MISDNKEIKNILRQAKTIAMIGCSPNKFRTSNYAAKYLTEKGYRVIPVNPEADRIYGEPSYDSMADIPHEVEIDIVNVFRNSRYSAEAVKEVVEWKKMTKQNPVIWTQLDVSSPEAEQTAEMNELPYIKNRCIMVEWDRNFK
jgi:predicted CoA-binding protein